MPPSIDKGVSAAARELGKSRGEIHRWLKSGALRDVLDRDPAIYDPRNLAKDIGCSPQELIRVYAGKGRLITNGYGPSLLSRLRFTESEARYIQEHALGFTVTFAQLARDARVPMERVKEWAADNPRRVMSRDVTSLGREPCVHFNEVPRIIEALDHEQRQAEVREVKRRRADASRRRMMGYGPRGCRSRWDEARDLADCRI